MEIDPTINFASVVYATSISNDCGHVNLDCELWQNTPAIVALNDQFGRPVPAHETEIRALWNEQNLYFLFVCPFEELHLRPSPNLEAETFELWNWDVAEVFIGADFENIRHYKEFEVSPQGEWVDLDVDLDLPHPEEGWVWESGCRVEARIDPAAKIWYGSMQIPLASIIDQSSARISEPARDRPAAAGDRFRVNFFRCQGSDPNRKEICWQPTFTETFHVPEAFGILELR